MKSNNKKQSQGVSKVGLGREVWSANMKRAPKSDSSQNSKTSSPSNNGNNGTSSCPQNDKKDSKK